MKLKFPKTLAFCLFVGIFGTQCSSDHNSGGSGSGGDGTTYSLTGTLSPEQEASSINAQLFTQSFTKVFSPKVNRRSSTNRTQCADGFYYSVFCVSYTTPPVAAEGDVDCSGNGAFEVAGLPVGEAVGCFVRRYDNDTDSGTAATTVGTIQIPAPNLNGSTEQLVSSGDVDLSVNIGADGTISAEVVSGEVDTTPPSAGSSDFNETNISGLWELSCETAAANSALTEGRCRCFLGDLDAAGYTGDQERACLADNGARINGPVKMGIGIYVYDATTNSPLVVDDRNNVSLPTGASINAISIWGSGGTSGNYTPGKGSGGEGASDLNGVLAWNSSGTHNPVAAVNWASSVDPGNGPISVPIVPSNTAPISSWIIWAQTLTTNSVSAGYACSRESSSEAQSLPCVNEALQRISDVRAARVPNMYIMPYCDQNGCIDTTDVGHNGVSNANAFAMARVDVRGLHFNYSGSWTTASDYSALTPESHGIGIEPNNRFVFEPLMFFPGGAGFRQSDHNERHFRCGQSQHDIQNSACDDTEYFELRCQLRDELAIKFLGTQSPMKVFFDSNESVVHGVLLMHDGSGPPQRQTPTGTSAIKMCESMSAGRGSIFRADAVKQ